MPSEVTLEQIKKEYYERYPPNESLVGKKLWNGEQEFISNEEILRLDAANLCNAEAPFDMKAK